MRRIFGAAIVVVVGGAMAATAAQSVRTGAEAFGGWRDDAPGVQRHFTVDDLVAPYATPSGANSGAPVARPANVAPKVPEGFQVNLVASGIDNPRAIRFAPNGDLFVANSAANLILVVRPTEGATTPVPPHVFARIGLDRPYGIAFYPSKDPEWVYVANTGSVVRFPYKAGDLEASGAPETVVAHLPTGGHWTRDIAFSADERTMFVSVGSASNVAEGLGASPPGGLDAWRREQRLGAAWGAEARRADVLAFDPDGGNEHIYATGLRNCAGMAVQPLTGALWCVVNERDGLGDNLPFDYATQVREGAFYGWPWYYIGAHEDPRHRGARPDLADRVSVPGVLIQAHSAPLNIAFYASGPFGADYGGAAFVALHGSWNRSTRTGYKVVKLEIGPDGTPTGVYEDFMTGFVLSDRQVWGRPVGVAVSPDGALFVSEDGNGTIWKVSRR